MAIVTNQAVASTYTHTQARNTYRNSTHTDNTHTHTVTLFYQLIFMMVAKELTAAQSNRSSTVAS